MSLAFQRSVAACLLGTLAVLPSADAIQGDAFPVPPKPVEQEKPAASAAGGAPSPVSSGPTASADGTPDLSAPDLPPAVARHRGSWDEGYAALRTASEAGNWDEALEHAEALLQPSFLQNIRVLTLSEGKEWQRSAMTKAEPLFNWFGLMQPGDRERAELRFARGFLRASQARELLQEGTPESGEAALKGTEQARQDYSAARALAGPGSLRRDATYSQSRVVAERAEEARLGIPEVREKLGLPALPPTPPAAAAPSPGSSPGPDAEEEDPDADLKAVRELYLTAREPLLERLRLGAFDDADVQANLELIQRRLRELASIERQREEQQQEQENEQQGDEEQEQDQQDPSEENQEGEDSENSESQDGEGEDQESDPSQQEPPPEGEDESEGEEESDQEPELPEEGWEPTDEVPEDAERQLTREEVMRLLKQLEKIEEEGEGVRRQVRQGQRVPVPRDW